jgi:starch synthase
LRVLYLNYGRQSGVTAAVVEQLRAVGHEVAFFDALEGFLYKRRVGPWRVPNLAIDPVLATAAALARFGRHWKRWYVHTCWAFDRLTARCQRAITAWRPDVIFQAGALFAPGRDHHIPCYLYCDHTRALNESYPAVDGLEPAIPFQAAWRQRETAVYRRAAAVFVMSEHVKRSLTQVYGIDPARVHTVGAGPNASPALPVLAPRRPETFLFVGKQFVHKGGPALLAAFEVLRARHPAAQLWMVGGQQPPRGPPGVRLLGRLPVEEVARLYPRASAFVLPTLREAFGLAFLEAMSFGLPCIGTSIEAIPEIVIDGETGLLVPPGDPAALAQAMIAFAGDPLRARAMGEAGRRRVRERFGWDRAVQAMLQVIERRPVARPPNGSAGAPRHRALRRMVPNSPPR